MSDESSGSHLAAGHSIDRIVNEEDGNFFAAIGGVNDFGGSDRGKVAIALVGNHDLAGTSALDSGGTGGSASVGELHVAHIEIVIGEYGAADGADEDGFVLEAEIFESFGDELVGDAVAAAGAVVSLLLQVGLALVNCRRTGRDFECSNFVAVVGQDFGSLRFEFRYRLPCVSGVDFVPGSSSLRLLGDDSLTRPATSFVPSLANESLRPTAHCRRRARRTRRELCRSR